MFELKGLLAGESWMSLRFDIEGFDFLSRSTYHEAIGPLQYAPEATRPRPNTFPPT